MTFGKRQLVIAALVAALGAAVYLNWQFSGTEPISVVDTQVSESSKQLGQTTYVNTEISQSSKQTSSESSKNSDSKSKESQNSNSDNKTKAVNTSEVSSTDGGYFSADRKNRNEAHEKSIESLSDIIESASSSESAKKEAVSAAEKLANIIKTESDLEAEIKSKGFEDCLVSINNNSCSIIVYKGTLDDSAAIAIKDAVNRQAGIEFDKITIQPKS